MAYLTVTNGAVGQTFGYDSNNSSNLTINLIPDNIKVTVQTLKAGLAVAEQMAAAFGINTDPAPAATETPAASDEPSGS